MITKPNIIFIMTDALRAKNLGCYRYERPTSPNIDNLSKEGILFKEAFSSNNSTQKSLIAILSGRHILLKNFRNFFLTKNELTEFFGSGGVFLQEILKKYGYKTYHLREAHGWQKKGFDYFYSIDDKRLGNEKWQGALKQKGRDSLRKVVHYIFPKNVGDKIKAKYGRTCNIKATEDTIKIIQESKKKGEKFFILIYYNDTHIPYNPKEFTGKFKSEKEDKKFFKVISKGNHAQEMIAFWRGAFSKRDSVSDIVARYDSAIFYEDYLIGRVIKALKEETLFDDTLIFLFSDHGESLGEHDIYFTHHGLYDITTRFPLIIYGKDLPKNKRIEGFVQHEDFVPTILDLLKIRYDPLTFDGKSLLPLIKKGKKLRESVFMEEEELVKKRALRTKEYKYIEASSKEDAQCKFCNKIHGGIIELYDLKKDPEENTNIAKKEKATLKTMKMKLDSEIKTRKRLNEKRRLKKIFSENKQKRAKYL